MFSKPLRVTAFVVVSFFAWTFGGGATLAQAAKVSRGAASIAGPAREKSPEERLEAALSGIEAALADPAADLKLLRQELKVKKEEIKALDAEIRRQFADTAKKLESAKLPAEILDRHEKFVRHYNENLLELNANLAAIEKAETKGAASPAIGKAKAHLAKVKAPSRHQPLDPNKLPHRAMEPVKREPRLKKEEFERSYGKDRASLPRPVRVASAGDLTGLLPANDNSEIDLGLPSIEDLAGTPEVQITQAIQAKAAELGHDPVRIYNWVRNSIEFAPTWGSIQGAQMAMETKQGNAFDTASLLISLLRASGIHARYVMGTVELPIDQIMNWAGGFTDPNAALDFMSSGGIPTTALTEGGVIKAARFEHVWVEAWIDYIPSRGAKHREGRGDTWIPLDPSFKQYAYTAGMDLAAAVPFDAQTFVDQLKATATINEAEGYATGVNGALVQQTMTDYQGRVEAYIAQNYPDATVGDVLGKKEIVAQDHPYLLGTLPYTTAVRGGAYSILAGSLRHKLTFTVQKDAFDPSPLTITRSLPELAGKKITLSYAPATAADEAVIESYLPQPHADGTPIQPEELPTSLPAYLINVKPELRIDGQVVATGSTVSLGATETFTMTFVSPYSNDPIINPITAGAYHAVALDLGRISEEQGESLKARLESTKNKLETQDFAGLTKDELVGDLLYTTALMYHAELGVVKQIAARAGKVASVTWPSETIFKTDLVVDSMFGLPRSVSAGGLAMDADRLASINTALDGDQQKKINYLLQTGTISSALEHSVPEKLFSTPENRAEGVSAVKALQIANEQGIPIYTVTQVNFANVMPQLQLDAGVKADIQNAVNAGKTVTVSKSDITFNSWIGCGYIIIDPTTGAGGYMISGGLSGSFQEWFNGLSRDAQLGLFFAALFLLLASPILLGASILFLIQGSILMAILAAAPVAIVGGALASQFIDNDSDVRDILVEILIVGIGVLTAYLFVPGLFPILLVIAVLAYLYAKSAGIISFFVGRKRWTVCQRGGYGIQL